MFRTTSTGSVSDWRSTTSSISGPAPHVSEPPELDESQLRVAEAPADARMIVTAGAGQGKTEVVAARLRHLLESEGLTGTDDLLVLSFSRAAVAAVQGRVRGDSLLAAVTVRTFDSFA